MSGVDLTRAPVGALAQPPTGRIEVIRADGGAAFAAVVALRRRVFGDEQGIADLVVRDRDDDRSLHALALLSAPDGPRPVGTGRLTPGFGDRGEALVAWVATLPEVRRRGVGAAVMRFLLAAADRAGTPYVVLAAQTHAEGFYRRLGFVPAGQPYDVRGIEHRWRARPRPC